MKQDIVNTSGDVIFSCEVDDPNPLRAALRRAVTTKANLCGANLYDADLRGANLGDANLCGANLYDANLGGANLRGADLGGANLRGADLRGANVGDANLGGANLRGANLGGANLGDANLCGANLGGANLRDADLRGADLFGADLRGADLGGADLCGADLGGADLCGANLREANLREAKGTELAIAQSRILAEGDLIGWKKCRNNVIVKLLIPADSPRSHAFGRKCRAKFVKVLELHGGDSGTSVHDQTTVYHVGETVTCDAWSEDWQEECAGGIHFYITRLEAENHF